MGALFAILVSIPSYAIEDITINPKSATYSENNKVASSGDYTEERRWNSGVEVGSLTANRAYAGQPMIGALLQRLRVYGGPQLERSVNAWRGSGFPGVLQPQRSQSAVQTVTRYDKPG
ncbi:uncharacterized protein An11g01480 [Aspergillus niger]|uniref:Contig An11c0050, genomic contig n=2 Tax=Aspergillus niger TaxID=5061 RepID=A2QVH8_ASPNC|nr:uncharacterized protein An11g01480 [Aspergillus niger]CAK45882.1 unnamed protein product [Aspergillus niger]